MRLQSHWFFPQKGIIIEALRPAASRFRAFPTDARRDGCEVGVSCGQTEQGAATDDEDSGSLKS